MQIPAPESNIRQAVIDDDKNNTWVLSTNKFYHELECERQIRNSPTVILNDCIVQDVFQYRPTRDGSFNFNVISRKKIEQDKLMPVRICHRAGVGNLCQAELSCPGV